MTDLLPETTYGVRKRLHFISEVIGNRQPQSILDVGCGSGELLCGPLAAAHPHIRFTATDSDALSIEIARSRQRYANLELIHTDVPPVGNFDLIIASEVIEHVEDPSGFLRMLASRLNRKGTLIVTVPNGYGPFEFTSLLTSLAAITGLYAVARRIRDFVRGRSRRGILVRDTYAVSPHINFFSIGALYRLFAASGFRVVEFKARTFLCGLLFDSILRGNRALAWNTSVADHLPRALVSGWMFVLVRSDSIGSAEFRRNLYSRVRRYLNEKRYGLR